MYGLSKCLSGVKVGHELRLEGHRDPPNSCARHSSRSLLLGKTSALCRCWTGKRRQTSAGISSISRKTSGKRLTAAGNRPQALSDRPRGPPRYGQLPQQVYPDCAAEGRLKSRCRTGAPVRSANGWRIVSTSMPAFSSRALSARCSVKCGGGPRHYMRGTPVAAATVLDLRAELGNQRSRRYRSLGSSLCLSRTLFTITTHAMRRLREFTGRGSDALNNDSISHSGARWSRDLASGACR